MAHVDMRSGQCGCSVLRCQGRSWAGGGRPGLQRILSWLRGWSFELGLGGNLCCVRGWGGMELGLYGRITDHVWQWSDGGGRAAAGTQTSWGGRSTGVVRDTSRGGDVQVPWDPEGASEEVVPRAKQGSWRLEESLGNLEK